MNPILKSPGILFAESKFELDPDKKTPPEGGDFEPFTAYASTLTASNLRFASIGNTHGSSGFSVDVT